MTRHCGRVAAASNFRANQFQFGYVCGSFAWSAENDYVDALWEGNDEMDPAMGRGWAIPVDDGLHGMIFIHQGDESEFEAERV